MGLRGGGGHAPMRAPPRAAAGLRAASRPPPPAALERAGCSLTASGRRGRGVKSAPPPRPRLLGASPFEPAGETSAAWGWGPYLECWGAEAPVLTPHTHFWGPGGLSCLEQPRGLHAKGEGQHCRQAPPPASGVAAGPASQIGPGVGGAGPSFSGKSESWELGGGKEGLPPLLQLGVLSGLIPRVLPCPPTRNVLPRGYVLPPGGAG